MERNHSQSHVEPGTPPSFSRSIHKGELFCTLEGEGSARAELAVAGVAEAGHDVGVGVQACVYGGGDETDREP